jgi:pimeloyl-ACP methyl ester carboxylesterase
MEVVDDEPRLTGGRVTSRDGTNLGFLALGEGPTVLCIHGALATGIDWLPIARLLADRYRLVMFDRRGHGASDAGAEGHTLPLEIEDVQAMLAATGPVRGILAHSFGAVVALHAVRMTIPDTVQSLVLYEPPIMLDPAHARDQLSDWGPLISAGEWEGVITSALTDFAGMTSDEIAMMRRSQRGWASTVSMAPVVAHHARMVTEVGRMVKPFEGLQQPTLLFLGEVSGKVFIESIDALADVIPHRRVVTLPQQAHSAMSRIPDVLADEIGSFLDANR